MAKHRAPCRSARHLTVSAWRYVGKHRRDEALVGLSVALVVGLILILPLIVSVAPADATTIPATTWSCS